MAPLPAEPHQELLVEPKTSTPVGLSHLPPSPPKTSSSVVNPELEKFRKICEPPAVQEPFWTPGRRKSLNTWTENYFGFTIVQKAEQ